MFENAAVTEYFSNLKAYDNNEQTYYRTDLKCFCEAYQTDDSETYVAMDPSTGKKL